MSSLFGAKMQHLRRVHGMTQGELARYLQLTSHSHLSNIEAGRKKPSLELVIRMAILLGETTDYLLRDSIDIRSSATTISSAPPRAKLTRISSSELNLYLQRMRSRLQSLRRERHLTDVELARRLGIPVEQARQIETGQTEMSIDLVPRIADIYEVTIDFLLLGKEQRDSSYR